MFWPGLIFAAPGTSITMNAGETYVIDHVKSGETPGVKVISNPNALVVHNEEPGKITLLGADAGEWQLKIKMADGSTALYDVTIKSVGNPFSINTINNPGSAPPPITGSGKTSGEAAPPVVGKFDKGAGPVGSATAGKGTVGTVSTSDRTSMVTIPPDSGAPAVPAPAVQASAAPVPSPVAQAPVAPPPPAAPPAPKQADSSGTSTPPLKYMTDPSIALTGGEFSGAGITGGLHYLPDDAVVVQTGTSRIIDFADRIRRISIADTTVADIQVINPFQINLIGHKPGFTTLAVWNKQGSYEERQIRVDANSKQQVLLNTVVAELNRSAVESQGTNLSAFLVKQGVALQSFPGYVTTPYSPTVDLGNTQPATGVLPNPGGLIPMLLGPNTTYALTAQNSNVQVEGLFEYLETHDLAKVLAQPHLLANSGEEAKFLDGGEIPIVIAQALNTSIVFKQFGTSVEFVPTVIGRDDVELLVKPEVSQPDFALGVQEFGFTIPAFITRKAETMVRLKDNQTLIIAGLLQHEKTTSINKVPYFGDIPYLGGLFRTTSYNNSESELVMSVTPQIVRPLPSPSDVYDPTTVPEMTRQQIMTRRLAHPDVTRPRF